MNYHIFISLNTTLTIKSNKLLKYTTVQMDLTDRHHTEIKKPSTKEYNLGDSFVWNSRTGKNSCLGWGMEMTESIARGLRESPTSIYRISISIYIEMIYTLYLDRDVDYSIECTSQNSLNCTINFTAFH